MPIDHEAETDMELLSDIVSWGEMYLHHWENGEPVMPGTL
jgi:hypothetical protein